MARRPRIHLDGGLYHVIFRGNGGEPVFFTDDDRFRFYLLLQEGTCRFGYHIHAFCLMTNHIHLALQVSDIPLSRGMQNLSFRYTRWINWRKKRTGHLFQGRYKAVLIDSDDYLLELVRYIHLNPVRAGMVEVAEQHPWSGHLAYLGKENLPWLTTGPVLEQFGRTVAKGRTGYKNFVLDGLGEAHRPEFHGKGEVDSRLLGSDSFVDKCLSDLEERPLHLTAHNIITKVCRAYAIEETELKTHSQGRIVSEARAVVGWLARELGCATLSEMARLVNRDVGSVSSAVRRLSERMQENPELTDRVRIVKDELEQLNNFEA